MEDIVLTYDATSNRIATVGHNVTGGPIISPPAPPATAVQLQSAPEQPNEAVTELPGPPLPPPTPLGVVRTRVWWDQDEQSVKIKCSHDLPSTASVLLHIEPEYRKKIKTRNYWSIGSHIQTVGKDVVPYQVWADAITKAVISKYAIQSEASSEMRALSQGGYLALGDGLYKLSCVGMNEKSKAITAIRKKLKEEAETAAKIMISNAEQTAKALIENAVVIKQEADKERARLKNEFGSLPPKWMIDSGFPIKSQSAQWMVQMIINFRITHFDVTWGTHKGEKQHSWEAPPTEPRKIRLWVPVTNEGTYTPTAVRTDPNDPQLPHIKGSGSCMGLAAGPKVLKTHQNVLELQQHLEFVHSRVQLNSLFSDIDYLIKHFPTSFPPNLVKLLNCANGENYSTRLAELTAMLDKEEKIKEINYKQEELETWRI